MPELGVHGETGVGQELSPLMEGTGVSLLLAVEELGECPGVRACLNILLSTSGLGEAVCYSVQLWRAFHPWARG